MFHTPQRSFYRLVAASCSNIKSLTLSSCSGQTWRLQNQTLRFSDQSCGGTSALRVPQSNYVLNVLPEEESESSSQSGHPPLPPPPPHLLISPSSALAGEEAPQGVAVVLVEGRVDQGVEEGVGVSQPQEDGLPEGRGLAGAEGRDQLRDEEGDPAEDEDADQQAHHHGRLLLLLLAPGVPVGLEGGGGVARCQLLLGLRLLHLPDGQIQSVRLLRIQSVRLLRIQSVRLLKIQSVRLFRIQSVRLLRIQSVRLQTIRYSQ